MSNKISITACDALHYTNVMANAIKQTGISADAYKHIHFEMGCKLVELIYPSPLAMRELLLYNEAYGYWNWFYVQYLKHDETISVYKYNRNNYIKSKIIWINTLTVRDAILNYYNYKKMI